MNPQLRRLVTDFGPLLLFFAVYRVAGIYAATTVVIAAAIAALGVGYWLDRKISPVPLFTAVVIAVLGGLTLYLRDPTFIKMKPTLVYGLIAASLLTSEIIGKPLIKTVMGASISLSDAHWRILAWRFAVFFFAMAVINELIWRNFSESSWVNYHTFGALALTLGFSLAQVPFLLKHQREDETPHGN
jgi:intracellular septation protein